MENEYEPSMKQYAHSINSVELTLQNPDGFIVLLF